MNFSEKVTGQQILEILQKIYEGAQDSESLHAKDLIMEMKQHIISVMQSSEV